MLGLALLMTPVVVERSSSLREEIPPLEENGFMIADVTRDKITLRFFRWNNTTQSEDEIDRLQAFKEIELPA